MPTDIMTRVEDKIIMKELAATWLSDESLAYRFMFRDFQRSFGNNPTGIGNSSERGLEIEEFTYLDARAGW